MRILEGATIVITGASSGIGRATAHAFAREGANLVLSARRADLLDQAVEECRGIGAAAVAVPADVTRPGDMVHLLDAAVDRFGRVDVWINNAGVGAVGWFEQVPLEATRRSIETNLLGAVNGAHAVIPHFIDRGRGVLINTCSVGSWVAPPLAVGYTAGKYGLAGLTEALRQDMRRFPGIQVCGVYPAFVDTPGLHHKGNYTGRRLIPGGPMQTPERIARVMVDVARHPRGRVPVGLLPVLGRIAYAVAPDLVGGAMFAGVQMALKAGAPARSTPGNLFQPPPDRKGVHGSRRQMAGLEPWIAGAGALGGMALGALAVRARR